MSSAGHATTGGVTSSTIKVAVELTVVPQTPPPSTTTRRCIVPVMPDHVSVVVVLLIGNQVLPLVLRSQRRMAPEWPLRVSVPDEPGQYVPPPAIVPPMAGAFTTIVREYENVHGPCTTV